MARKIKKANKSIKHNQQVIYVLVEGESEKKYIETLKMIFGLNCKIVISNKSKISNLETELDRIRQNLFV